MQKARRRRTGGGEPTEANRLSRSGQANSWRNPNRANEGCVDILKCAAKLDERRVDAKERNAQQSFWSRQSHKLCRQTLPRDEETMKCWTYFKKRVWEIP